MLSCAVCRAQCPQLAVPRCALCAGPGVPGHFGSVLAEQQPRVELSQTDLSGALKAKEDWQWRLFLAKVQEEAVELQTIVKA